MKVKELITELKKCNPDDIVMYDFNNTLANASYVIIDGVLKRMDVNCTIDEVWVGSGTQKGIVYLNEKLL